MAGGILIPPELSAVTDLTSSTNHTANSVLFIQVLAVWFGHLRSENVSTAISKTKVLPVSADCRRHCRPFLRLHEYEPEEYDFSGPVDPEDSFPSGDGVLTFRLSADNLESCVGGECTQNPYRIAGHFLKGGLLHGYAKVHFSNGDKLKAHFHQGALHGFAVRFDLTGQVISAGFYKGGRPTGCRWHFLHAEHSRVAFFVNLDDKSESRYLIHLAGYDVVALTGDFDDDGVLQGQGTVRQLEKMWFSDDGLMMHLSLGKELSSKRYVFHVGENVHLPQERFMAQAGWFYFTRYDEKEPRQAIKNKTILDLCPRNENTTKPAFFKFTSESPDLASTCGGMMFLDPTDEIAGAFRERHLACYPGSGSKWLLASVSSVLGYGTRGCVDLAKDEKYSRGSTYLIKTHHLDPDRWQSVFSVLSKHQSKRWSRWREHLEVRVHEMGLVHGRAILLVRNPYEALISFWNHDRSYTYDATKSGIMGVSDIGASLQSDLFRDFVRAEIALWEDIYLDYLSMGSDLLTVHYEEMKQNISEQVYRIANHLGFDDLDPKRDECLRNMRQDTYLRKNKPNFEDPFTPELRQLVESAIDKVQHALKVRNQRLMPLELYAFRKT